MFKIVSLQITVTLFVALLVAAITGMRHADLNIVWSAGLSAGLGGLVCVLPNALFALRLAIQAKRPGGANVATFFAGEFVKLGLTVALLFGVASRYHDLNWLALIIGFIVALKSYFLFFLFHKR